MLPFLPTIQDASTCLRCQYRLATRRPLRRKPLDAARDIVRPRFITSDGSPAQERVAQDDTVVHDSLGGPQGSFTGSDRANRPLWRHANLHTKDSLGVDVLGQPAEILKLRNELRRNLKKKKKVTFGEVNTAPDRAASSDELLALIDAERGIIGKERVRGNIESVKDAWLLGRRDHFSQPSISEVEDLAQRLRNGFTTGQLLEYFHEGTPSGTMEIDYDFSSELYKWSAWTPGNTAFPGHASSRLRSLRVTPLGAVSANRISSRVNKQTVIDKVMRQLWHIETEKDLTSLGELDVWIQAEHMDLILNHRRDVLKRLSEVYGAKVEASRSYDILRITADRETASDVVKLLKHILDSIERAELDLPTGGRKATKGTATLGDVLNKSLLVQIEQLTSTIIRTSRHTLSNGDQEKLTVYYLGPSDGDLEDVRRLISQALEADTSKETEVQIIEPLGAEKASLLPVEIGTGLPLNERSTEWSRWRSGIQKKSGETAGSRGVYYDKLPQVARSTYKFLYGKNQAKKSTASDEHGLVGSHWDKALRHNTSVVVGQVLYPATSSASMENLQKVKSRREFLTSIPGLHRYLGELRSRNLKQKRDLVIRLSPSRWSGSQTASTNDLPDLELRVAIDTENQTAKLEGVKLVIRERQSDLLFPDEAMDLRFAAESYLPASKTVDPRIRKFVEASNLNIWGQDRLKTPASLQLSIAPQAIRPRTRASNSSQEAGSETDVDYVFAGLSHRSSFQVDYLDFKLEYSIVEAGRTGGRRDKLRLVLPEFTDTPHTRECFVSFFKAALSLTQDLGSTKKYLLERRGGVVLRRRDGRSRSLTATRRRLVRRVVRRVEEMGPSATTQRRRRLTRPIR